MLKSLIDIDVRKATAFFGTVITIAVILSSNPQWLTDAIPALWIPHVVAWLKIIAGVGSALTTGHNIAALISPRDVPQPVIKSLVLPMILAIGLALFAAPAFAQGKKGLPIPLPLDPLGLNGSATESSSGIANPVGIDLKATWDKITAATQADLIYAKALADGVASPGSKLRSQCYAAILTANQQANGTTLKNPDGSPMVKPDPALITGVEQAAELVDNLSATAPLTAACAPAANALKQNVLQFIATIVTGAAAKTFTGGLLP